MTGAACVLSLRRSFFVRFGYAVTDIVVPTFFGLALLGFVVFSPLAPGFFVAVLQNITQGLVAGPHTAAMSSSMIQFRLRAAT